MEASPSPTPPVSGFDEALSLWVQGPGLIAADIHSGCHFSPPPPKQFLSHQPCAAVSGTSGLCPLQGIRDFTAALRWGLAERQGGGRWQAVRKEVAGGA